MHRTGSDGEEAGLDVTTSVRQAFPRVDLHAGGTPKPVRFLELPRLSNHAATKTSPLSLSALATTSRGYSASAIVMSRSGTGDTPEMHRQMPTSR